MSLIYRRVDMVLSSNAAGEVREGDCLLLDVERRPRKGELALVRRGRTESLCRYEGEGPGDVLGLVIGVKRRF